MWFRSIAVSVGEFAGVRLLAIGHWLQACLHLLFKFLQRHTVWKLQPASFDRALKIPPTHSPTKCDLGISDDWKRAPEVKYSTVRPPLGFTLLCSHESRQVRMTGGAPWGRRKEWMMSKKSHLNAGSGHCRGGKGHFTKYGPATLT